MNTSFKAALFHQSNAFYENIKGHSEDEKAARFNVYRNNIFVSLIDALADIFPVTQAIVGEDFFRAMARVYVQEHPPKSAIISDYGDDFAAFIRDFEPAQGLAFLSDLAALEFTLLALTNTQEHTSLKGEQISAAFHNTDDPTRLLLSLASSTHIVASPYAIGSIYLAHKTPDSMSLANIQVEKSEYLLVSKSNLYADCHIVSQAEAIFIRHLLQGKTLGEAIPDDDHFDLGVSLAKLIDWQLLTDISNA